MKAETAAFLDSGRTLALASQAAVITTALAIPPYGLARYAFELALFAWAAAIWFAVRVAIDAALFRALADDADAPTRLDSLLRCWGFTPPAATRTLEERARGAVRLWKLQAICTAIQILFTLAGFLLKR